MNALIGAAEWIAEDMDDDGVLTVVKSGRLAGLLAFAGRDREDIDKGDV